MSEEFDPLLLEHQLCFPLYAASKALIRQYEPYLEPLGITYTQYIVLMVLWEKGSATVNEVGERVRLDSGTLSPLLQKLEAKGLIEKKRTEDGRYRLLTLTPEGLDLKEKAKEIPEKIGSCLGLDPIEGQQLYTLCYKVLRNLQ